MSVACVVPCCVAPADQSISKDELLDGLFSEPMDPRTGLVYRLFPGFGAPEAAGGGGAGRWLRAAEKDWAKQEENWFLSHLRFSLKQVTAVGGGCYTHSRQPSQIKQ